MTWIDRVEAYLDELEVSADGLTRQMKDMRVDQVPPARQDSQSQSGLETSLADKVNEGTQRLAEALADLEKKVTQRETLLRAEDAPASGLTLLEKLESLNDQRSDFLRQRGEMIAEMIADINNHAVSLFVCQFHLANLTHDVVRIMAGVSEPTTYGATSGAEKLGGNLFSESA